MKKKKDSVYYQKDSITIKKNVKLSKIFRFFSIIICIFGLHNLNAQDFYWENPKTFVNADSFFPLVVKNSNESYVFWEEVQSINKEISISLRNYENLNDFYDNRNFSGVIKYSGNEVPDIYSAAVLENGIVAVCATTQNGEIYVFYSSNKGKSFEKTKIDTDLLLIAPKIYASSNETFVLFCSVGIENNFVLYYAESTDGKNWSQLKIFEPSKNFNNPFIPVLYTTKGNDIVVFQSQYLSVETNQMSYQLYLTKKNNDKWTVPVLLTDRKSLTQKSVKEFFEFQNQRPNMINFDNENYITWERSENKDTSIWIAKFNDNGIIPGSSQEITSKSNASRPYLFEYQNELYITWFDDRTGHQSIYFAKKIGEYWEEIRLLSDKNSNMFVNPLIIEDSLSFVWQKNKRISILSPDKTILPPTIKTINFSEGKKTNQKNPSFKIIFPEDSSQIAGYSFLWTKKDDDSEPPELIEHFPKENTLNFSLEESGEYVLKVKINDYAGNWSKTEKSHFVLDIDPPKPPKIQLSNLDKYGFMNSNTLTLQWEKSESEDTEGYVYRFDYAGAIPKSIAVSKNHPMKLSDSKVLEIKSELYEKYEKELLKQRKFPNNFQTQGLKSKKYYNLKNGVYVFSVSAIDECGNIGENSSELVILNKYQPSTFITSVETKKNEMSDIILTVYGGGFTYDGTISEIYIDKDGKTPYDLVVKKNENPYKVKDNSKIININLGNELEEGQYKIGLLHTDRGIYFSDNILTVLQSGTVKIEGEYYRQSKLRIDFESAKYKIQLNLIIAFILIVFVTLLLLFFIIFLLKSKYEKNITDREVRALEKGENMPLIKKENKKRLPSLKDRLIIFIYSLVVVIVLAVTMQNGKRIINLQEETMATALKNRSEVLLESICTGVKNFFPVNNLLELTSLPNQKNAMEEVKYITIIGQKHETNSSDNLNYVWATNDTQIFEKIDTPTLIYGESELTDSEINKITKKYLNLDYTIAMNLSDLSNKIEVLTKQAEVLYKSTLQEDNDEAERISVMITELRNEIDLQLQDYSKTAGGSYPDFDVHNINRKNKDFIFYKPVLYRQGTTENYVHAVVYLELSTQSLIDELDRSLFKIISFAILIAFFAVVVGGLGAYFFAVIIVRPIKKLESHVIMIGQTKNKILLKGQDVVIKQNDEIGRLGNAVNNMTHELIANAEEEKLTMDGKAVQKAFLPLEDSGFNNKRTFSEFNDDRLECFGYYEGESGVSGDYFDYKLLDDTWFCVIKCDAAGHGIPAAIIMTVVATIFRRFFDKWTYKKDGVNLSLLVEQINDFIEGLGLKGKFATLIICLLNRKNGELYMCNAGDNLVHIFDSQTKKMKLLQLSSSPTAGIFPSEIVSMKGGFVVEKTVLNHGDILFLYTDGIEESTRKIREYDYSVRQNKVEIKRLNPETHKEETEIKLEDSKEEFGYERIVDIIESVYNKKKYILHKIDNPNKQEKLEFDFTKCQGTVSEAVLALASLEKVFRLYKSPQISKKDYVKIDKKIDDFLLKYFNIYSEYAAKKSENVENSLNYIDYDMILEDEQSDDLTLLAIKLK